MADHSPNWLPHDKVTITLEPYQFVSRRAIVFGQLDVVSLSATQAQALAVMMESSRPAVVVVDQSGKYAGIVRRDDIVSTLVASLAGFSSQDSAQK